MEGAPLHRPKSPQPASHLISLALSDAGAFARITPPKEETDVIAVNDCNDDRTYHDKIKEISECTGYPVLPIPFFGSFIRMAPQCPGYTEAGTDFMLSEFKTGVVKRRAHVICAGSHGEECAWCNEYNVTVAQRIWLSREAKYVLKRAACPQDTSRWWIPGQKLRVFVTYHRRYSDLEGVHQRTRVLNCHHQIFSQLPIDSVMNMTDEQVLEVIAPHLMPLVAV